MIAVFFTRMSVDQLVCSPGAPWTNTRYFEDLRVGMRWEFHHFQITREMRDRHVALYGEDWPPELVESVRQEGIAPSTLIASILGGYMGGSNCLRIKALKERKGSFHDPERKARFHEPIRVCDTLFVANTVRRLLAHRDPSKEYGYAWVQQDVFNQYQRKAYERTLHYAIHKRAILPCLQEDFR